MILLKANSELKVIYSKLINTMGRDIKWTEVFVINNNNLILEGKDSVLLFDFGNKMISWNPVELHLKEESIVQITKYELLENVLNMTLYVFGKWKKIKGLTVEKDYSKLNILFGNFLNEINVEPVLAADNLRFFKGGIQITYEDIIQELLDRLKPQDEEESDETKDNESEGNEKGISKYNLGLWHKMVWTSGRYTFEREELSESDKAKSRIGNNFYMVAYKCPDCGEKLYLVIYPMGKELLIETDEKGVYLSRAYTCSTCHCLYTPKPHLLLSEGNVFCIDFEDDIEAYEDYLELIGKQGERTSNCNFNEYEADYNKKNSENELPFDETFRNMNSMSEKEIFVLQDKLESGFYPQKIAEKYYNIVESELKSRKYQVEDMENRSDGLTGKEKKQDAVTAINTAVQQETKGISNQSEIESGIQQESSINPKHGIKPETKSKLEGIISSKYSTRPRNSIDPLQKSKEDGTNVPKNLYADTSAIRSSDMNLHNQLIQGFDDMNINEDIDITVYNDKERELLQQVVTCKQKNYVNIIRVMEEIEKEDCSNSLKESILHSLKELSIKRGKKELDDISSKIPENISKAQYVKFKEAIELYSEIDHSNHRKHLDFKRDEAEKQEIAAYIKRANAKDRNSFLELYNKLKQEDFEKRNLDPFLENIYDKLYAIDEAAIKKICPDPAELVFDDGLEAYKEISSKDLLPELKSNILGMIDKRLTKLKMNECEQLVNKLSKDMSDIIPELSRIHFYDVRKGIRNNSEDEAAKIINKALDTYAAGRGRYEFPIVICDTSLKANGGKGFVLTADHIFYNNFIEADVIDVMKIENIINHKRLFSTGIFAETNNRKIKISNSLQLNKLESFAKVLHGFVSYLKEKPESRDISYLAKEKHSVKCCYRCGYVYKGGNVCPKCYAKFNE
jgi:hypothetical protein